MEKLTDEQRRRMEENRQKALAKRAAAMANQNQNAPNTQKISPASSSFVSHGTNNGHAIKNPSTQSQSAFPTTSKSFPNTTSPSKLSNSNAMPTMKQQNLPFSNTISKPAFQVSSAKSAPISGTCCLISRDRFVVNIGYHPQLVNTFKTISGCSYDPNTKKWTFPVSEHGNLLVAAESLKPSVVIGGLPQFILRLCRSAEFKYDSSIDPSILSKIGQELVTSLFEFQKEGICFGVRKNGRVLIADDMGLGKTIQALGIAHYYYDEWPLLIACPSSMRYSWREAIWKWLPSVPVGSIVVCESSKSEMLQFSKVVILTYDLLQRRQAQFQNFKVVIMDESHNLKSFKTARSKAALPIIQGAKRAILLSGTPCLSRPIELYTQISAVNRNCFPKFDEYGIRYCNGKKNTWGWDFSGSSNMEELQIILKETIMVRRLKSDVLKQLPPKRRKAIPMEIGRVLEKSSALKMTKAAYVQAKRSYTEKRGKLLEYYSETAKAKLEGVTDYIKYLIEQDKKFLCFGHHQTMLDGVSHVLDSLKIKYIRIDGTTSSEERHFLCDQFQYGDDIRVAVLSICAANSGITLTAAHLVLFAELFWNPGILTQAEDRVHRIGQEDSVLIEYLVAPGTSDDIMWPMLSDKLEILNKAGLSKDNFREADVEILKKKDQKQINEYFQSTNDCIPSEEELKELFSQEFEDESEQSVLPDGPKKMKY